MDSGRFDGWSDRQLHGNNMEIKREMSTKRTGAIPAQAEHDAAWCQALAENL
jgi:hypothetical protein